MLSVHICNRSASATQTNIAEATIDNQPKRRSPTYQIGTTQNSTEANLSFDEQVLIIPVEDILSICYRTDTKKELKIQTTSKPIRRSWKKKRGCCRCADDEESEPEHRTNETIENKSAKRVIVVTIEYLRYGRIDTPSHVRILNESDRVAFYRSRMNVDILQFYLLISEESNPNQFNLQRKQAETLSCLITCIKQMAPQGYPSESQLQEIVQMKVVDVFGVELQEPTAMIQSSTKQIPRITQPIYDQGVDNSGFF